MANSSEPEAVEPEDETSSSEKLMLEEHMVWSQNAKMVYDVYFSRRLEWPSLTVEWLPGTTPSSKEGWKRHQLVIGTHAAGVENDLQILSVEMPSAETEIDTRTEFGVDTSDTVLTLKHPGGEANRVRHNPLAPTLLASKCANGLVHLFDIEKGASDPEKALVRSFKGHEDEGYGLAWDRQNRLFSAGYDGSLCLFDISTDDALVTSKGAHGVGAPIGDVAVAPKREDLFATVGDDKRILLWDPRAFQATSKPVLTYDEAHTGDINSIAFASKEAVVQDHFFVTGSSDKTMKLWDLRSQAEPLHVAQRNGDVVVVSWAPFGSAFVAAATASDRRVAIFDLAKIGADTSDIINATGIDDSGDDKPTPELIVDHCGHTGKLNDVAWNLSEDMLAASVADDNSLQLWWLSSTLYDDGEGDDDNDDRAAGYDFFDTLLSSKPGGGPPPPPTRGDDGGPDPKRLKSESS